MNTFKNDLKEAKISEEKVLKILEGSKGASRVLPTTDVIDTDLSIKDLERKYGDLCLIKDTKDSERIFVEVKRDKSMETYGNLFLEDYSDDGSRSGRVDIGWFNPESTAVYDWYVFHNVKNPSKSVMVKREDLHKLHNDYPNRFTHKAMRYNQTQRNRSTGYCVKYNFVVEFCESARYITIQ